MKNINEKKIRKENMQNRIRAIHKAVIETERKFELSSIMKKLIDKGEPLDPRYLTLLKLRTYINQQDSVEKFNLIVDTALEYVEELKEKVINNKEKEIQRLQKNLIDYKALANDLQKTIEKQRIN